MKLIPSNVVCLLNQPKFCNQFDMILVSKTFLTDITEALYLPIRIPTYNANAKAHKNIHLSQSIVPSKQPSRYPQIGT